MDMNQSQSQVRELLTQLKGLNYFNEAKTPQQLVKLRKEPGTSEVYNFFALGLPQSYEGLWTAGISKSVLDLFPQSNGLVYPLWAVTSTVDGELFLHSHWPPSPKDANYVHLGPESFYIAQEIKNEGSKFNKVLDLGCGMGILSFAFPLSTEVVGIDISESAVVCANFYKNFLNRDKTTFLQGTIGEASLDRKVEAADFDLVVFNPPLAVPGETPMIHRDGGALGLEIPKLFLQYAAKKLKPQGEAWFIVGDPLVGGHWMMKDYIRSNPMWDLTHYEVVEEYFNQGTARKHGYETQGIDHINLVVIKVRKK